MKLWTICFLGLPLFALANGPTPPPAPVHEVEDDYWGVKISDPYRWLENVEKDPEAQKWLKAQADFTKATLESLPGYQKLKDRFTELANSEPATISGPRKLANGSLFYLKTLAGQNTAKLCFRKSASSDEAILVDPDTFSQQDGKPRAINFWAPSDDGTRVAYGISAQGSEDASIHIVETETKKESSETIPRCEGSVVSWLPDGRHFLYTQLQQLRPGQPGTEKYLNSSTKLHELGADPEKDPVYLTTDSNPSVQLSREEGSAIFTIPGCSYCFVAVNKFVENEQRLYVAPLDQLKPDTKWIPLCDYDDQVTGIGVNGSDFYFLTHKDAPKFKITVRSLAGDKLTPAKDVVPESDKVVQELISAKDGVYYTASAGVDCRVYRISHTGDSATSNEVPLPYQGWPSFYDLEDVPPNNLESSGVLLNLSSWTQASAFYEYDSGTKAMVALKLQREGPYDHPADLVSEELEVKSHDGVMVPLSLIGLRSFKKDGTHPVRMIGYGAYGIVDEPAYSPTSLVALEHGMWQAVAHVRGGGAEGDAWHRAGMKSTKPNTWKDFIACGEYLIQNQISDKNKLIGLGGSAGGILIGRAVTERPDLFAIACPIVGALDTLRSELTPNGPPNIPEFGTVKNKEEFAALREMSTYDHIVPGTKYPALLFYHGLNDPRVPVWMSAKTAARFQAATTSGKPVLLDIDYQAGHGVGNTRTQQIKRSTDLLAFALWQCGDPEFQPKARPQN